MMSILLELEEEMPGASINIESEKLICVQMVPLGTKM